MRLISAVLVCCAVLGLSSKMASAAEVDVVGKGCIPADSAFSGRLYYDFFDPQPDIRWASGKSGTITLYCPIPANGFSFDRFYIFAYNNNGCTSCNVGCTHSDYINASYVKMNKTTGAVSTIASVSTLGFCNQGGDEATEISITDSYSSNYVYYIKVDMVSSTGAQGLYGLTLWHT